MFGFFLKKGSYVSGPASRVGQTDRTGASLNHGHRQIDCEMEGLTLTFRQSGLTSKVPASTLNKVLYATGDSMIEKTKFAFLTAICSHRFNFLWV